MNSTSLITTVKCQIKQVPDQEKFDFNVRISIRIIQKLHFSLDIFCNYPTFYFMYSKANTKFCGISLLESMHLVSQCQVGYGISNFWVQNYLKLYIYEYNIVNSKYFSETKDQILMVKIDPRNSKFNLHTLVRNSIPSLTLLLFALIWFSYHRNPCD